MNLSEISDLYHQQYQRDSISEQAMRAWEQIAGVLVAHFPKRQWVDVGCGGGGLVYTLRLRGHDAYGIEGSTHVVGLLPIPILLWDLREPLRQVPSANVATCFDVAEHVGNAEAVVKTCSDLARDVLIFGAAPPGQDGLGHIDLRPHEWWTEAFEERGFTYLPGETAIVKQEIVAQPGTNFLWWIHKNLHIYQRTRVA